MKAIPNFQSIWSVQLLADFLKIAFPLILSQIGFALPAIFSSSMVGSLGDITAVTVMGLSYTYFSLLNFAFVVATIEVTGASCSKAFGAQNYHRMASFFYKSLATIVAINVVYLLGTWAFSFRLFILIGVERSVAERTTHMTIVSMPGFFVHGINQLLQTYLMSQGIVRQLNYIAMSSLLISIFAGRYFIKTKDLREVGHAYSVLIQEVVNFFIGIFLLIKKAHGETLVLPSRELIAEDGKVFLMKNLYSLMGVYGEFLFWEMNTVLLATIGTLEDIAAWVIYGIISFVAYALALGLSNAFRTRLGQVIGSGHVNQARNLSIVYYWYTLLVSSLFTVILLIFAPEISGVFIQNDEVLPLVTNSMYALAVYMFPLLALNTFFAVFRLLNMDAYFFKMSTIVLPSLGLILSLFLTCYWHLGFIGVVLGQGLCYQLIVTVFFIKIYKQTDWKVQANRDKKMKLLCNSTEVVTI